MTTQQTAIASLANDLRENDYEVTDAQMLSRDLADELREFSPLDTSEIERFIASNPGAVIVFADPSLDLPASAFPQAGIILSADGEQVEAKS
jgi:hypothetical protein